ncbi:hypothetical protein RRG08_038145 [Elysia crispata]|uniref:Uncharacterized protein n=1 Tax=Elysia crispata TaxID=231223 RepID=A0AAE1DPB1_9GAST|nr:hypothetical protein RRG08_038145 [Elysia crispata]
MPWPVWDKASDEIHKSSGTNIHVQSPTLKRSSVLDTVDSFKLEPSSKIRHASSRNIRDTGLNLRPSHLNIPARISQFGARLGTSVTGIQFEPKSITEFKRLRYITNRDIHRKQSIMPSNLIGAKSGSYDKHCVFVSVTGITVKLNLGQRRPVEASYSTRLTWTGLRKSKDKVPRYASSVSYISIHMTDAALVSSSQRRTVTNDVAFYMSKDRPDKKTKTDSSPDAQTLKRSLELQAETLDNHFSSRPSVDSLNTIGPKLSFVWDEMGLSLQPLSTTATSLYEVLTKDKVRLKKDAPTNAKEKPPQRKKSRDDKSTTNMTKAKKSWQDKRSSSFDITDLNKLDHSNLREPSENKHLKTKKSHFLSSEKDGETLKAKSPSPLTPIPGTKTHISSKMARKGSETSPQDSVSTYPQSTTKMKSLPLDMGPTTLVTRDKSLPHEIRLSKTPVRSTEESEFSTISAEKQTAREETLRKERPDSLDYSQAKEMKTLETAQLNLNKLNQIRHSPLSKDSEITVPRTPHQSVHYEITPFKMSANSAEESILPVVYDNKQPLKAPLVQEEITYSFTPPQARGLETLPVEESFQNMLQTKEDLDLQPKIKSENQPLMHEETPLVLPKPQAQSLKELEPKELYQNILYNLDSKLKIKSEKQPSVSSSFSEYRSPISSRASWDYNSAFLSRIPSDYKSIVPSRTQSDYKSVITTRSASLSTLESNTPPERSIPSGKENFTQKLQVPQAMTAQNGELTEEIFYDCISLEEKRSSLSSAANTRSRARRYISRLSSSIRRAVRWIAKQIIGNSDRNNEIGNEEDVIDDSETIYFSPRGSSHQELNNITNSNSASQIWLLYWELWKAQLELKELWAENIKLKRKLGHETTVNEGCFT